MKAQLSDPRPIPGALDGVPWDVRVSPPQALGSGRRALGATNARERQMFVPSPVQSGPALARWVALHELGHAKWTPTGRAHTPAAICRKHPPATEQDVQVCEDLRVNSLLHRAGLLAIPKDTAEEIASTAQDWAKAALKPSERSRLLEALTLSWVQCAVIDYGDRVGRLDSAPVGREHKTLLGLMHRAAVELAATVPGSDPEGVRVALAEMLSTAEKIGRDVSKVLAGQRGTALPFGRVGKAAALLRRCLLAAMDAEDAGKHDPKGKLPPISPDGSVDTQWGQLVDMPALPLTESTPAEAAMRRRVGVPAGTRLGSLRRLLTDGRCFRRDVSRPAKGGTVLIDTSGSMSLDPADVHAILAELPAATVAIYSGRQDHGTVSIIARNGRTATAKAIRERVRDAGGGNIVDGPVLQWLGQQAEPRHWVCDGIVTGCGDATTRALQLEAEALRRRTRAIRSESLGALKRRLSGEEGAR